MRLFKDPTVKSTPVQSPEAPPPASKIKVTSPHGKKRTLLIQTRHLFYSKNSNALFSQSFQVKRFWDDMVANTYVAITYKENFVDGKPSPSDINVRLMKRKDRKLSRKQKLSPDSYKDEGESKYEGYSLEKFPEAEGQWRIKDHNNNTFIPSDKQPYIFVTMPNGTIRIDIRREGFGHLSLSDNSRRVRYAGEIEFTDKGQIKSWTNGSNSYCPPPCLASQAGFFGETSRFRPTIDRNDPEKQSRPIFSPRK